VVHDLNIDDFKSKPPDCICASSPFIYNLADHVITGDLNIINNTDVFAKGPLYRAPKSINWKHSLALQFIWMSSSIMPDNGQNVEKGDLNTLSEWVKCVKSHIQIRIQKAQWVYEHSLYINH